MKRLWIAAGILVLIFTAALCNTWYLGGFTAGLAETLTLAEVKAEGGDWDGALEDTQQAQSVWRDHDIYLHVLLRHSDTDEIYLAFQEVLELIQCRQAGEYSAANARLTGRIGLLYEAEQLTMKNVF